MNHGGYKQLSYAIDLLSGTYFAFQGKKLRAAWVMANQANRKALKVNELGFSPGFASLAPTSDSTVCSIYESGIIKPMCECQRRRVFALKTERLVR